jgi:hypothetical protein
LKISTAVMVILLFLTPVIINNGIDVTSSIAINENSTLSSSHNWLNGWEFRKSHTIEGSLGAGPDYQIRVIVHHGSGIDIDENVYCNSLSESNFDDIRFTDDNGTTELAHWRESYYDSDNATFWVRVQDNLNVTQSIYVYFGNIAASSASDGEATFLFFDDFEGTQLDTINRWTLHTGSIDVSGGFLHLDGAAGTPNAAYLYSQDGWGPNIIQELKAISNTPNPLAPRLASFIDSDYGWNDAINGLISGGSNNFLSNVRNDDVWSPEASDSLSDITSWHEYSVYWIPGEAGWAQDQGIPFSTHSSFVPDADEDLSVIFTEAVSVGDDLDIDWVFVRQYIVTEPNHGGWGPLEIEFPVIDAPSDVTYEAGTTGHEIDWTPSDSTPTSFSLYLDGVLQDSGVWDGSIITASVDGLDLGTYNFTLQVFDFFDNSATDTVLVFVEDTTVPILTHPADLEYNASDTGNVIEWTMSDLYPASYEISRDNELVASGSWNSSGESVHISVDGFAAGTYTLNLTATDLSGNSAFDLVTVVVYPSPLFGPDNMVLILMIGGVAVVVILGAVVCRSKRT